MDVKISQFSMQVNGQQLVEDCDIELNVGRRYGLLGVNGCGKSNLLAALANRELPVPEHVDAFHLREEAEPAGSRSRRCGCRPHQAGGDAFAQTRGVHAR